VANGPTVRELWGEPQVSEEAPLAANAKRPPVRHGAA
jgi:hypothetical protein